MERHTGCCNRMVKIANVQSFILFFSYADHYELYYELRSTIMIRYFLPVSDDVKCFDILKSSIDTTSQSNQWKQIGVYSNQWQRDPSVITTHLGLNIVFFPISV